MAITPLSPSGGPGGRSSGRTAGRTPVSHLWRAMSIFGGLLLVAVVAWNVVTVRAADQAQAAMAEEWSRQVIDTSTDAVGPVRPPRPPTGARAGPSGDRGAPPDHTAAIARVEVRRRGQGTLLGGPFFVGEGIEQWRIDRGPSHYPTTAMPGGNGNFAVAGHRTTHGAPFSDLDQVRPGDEVRVTDRAGRHFVYRVVEQRIVSPSDTWVVDPDPRGTGRSTLTFTTCHPRYSARQRLVVWAELAR